MTSPHLILVADDDPDILQLVVFRLQRLGHEVLTASNGQDALDLAREWHPALAVLDVSMPGLTGYQVTEALRSDPETTAIRIVLLTARVQDADIQRGREVGADAYMTKPFSPQELAGQVQELLGEIQPVGRT